MKSRSVNIIFLQQLATTCDHQSRGVTFSYPACNCAQSQAFLEWEVSAQQN